MSSQFDITVEREPGLMIIRPIGELDIASADKLAAVVDRECVGQPDLLIDLSGLSFLDCAGLRVLLYADARAKSNACNLRLIRGPAIVQRVTRLAGIEDRLPFATA